MKPWPSLAALAVLAAIAILTWVAVLVVLAVPAFPAQVQPSAYDACLLRTMQSGGYYTSLDGGGSALSLMHQCDVDRAEWVVKCVGGDAALYSDCFLKSGMRALLTIVAIEDLRALGR